MITFIDGPAIGQRLMLKRIPILLRVVQNSQSGEWDALDQLADKPRHDEKVHVYLRGDEVSMYHVLCRRGAGSRSGTGWYYKASYRLFETQPDAADVRTNDRWQAWAKANAPVSNPRNEKP